MSEPFPGKPTSTTPAAQLSKLLNLDDTVVEAWRPDDLRAMAQHQLNAPLEFDLGSLNLSPSEQRALRDALAAAARSSIRTFGALYLNPQAPLELLKLSKRFFKQNSAGVGKNSPEWQLAYLFYLLSIAAAFLHHRVKISQLPEAELARAVRSLLTWPWIDPRLRLLLIESEKRFAGASRGA